MIEYVVKFGNYEVSNDKTVGFDYAREEQLSLFGYLCSTLGFHFSQQIIQSYKNFSEFENPLDSSDLLDIVKKKNF